MKCTVRKLMLFVASLAVKCLWFFPIRRDKIIFLSFKGQVSDSPKYVYEYLINSGYSYCYYWVVKGDNIQAPEGCYSSKPNGINFFYNLVTSKVIVTNDYLNTYYPRRKGQIVVNTWHGGSPLKTVGMVGTDVTDDDRDFFKRHDDIYSCFLSSSNFMTKEVFRKSFGYTGIIKEIGMPRNAVLLRDHSAQEKKVRDYFGIGEKQKIVLYAPTFRGETKHGAFLPKEQQFDVEMCIQTLERRFGEKFCFLFRAHHACHVDLDLPGVYGASDYPDMQELLCASDVLITDYSSCMGDEALMYKPVFLYCPDLDEYIKERGFYWDIYSLPFPVSKSQNELFRSVIEFDVESYKYGIEDYLHKLGTFENEKSDEIAGEMIVKFMNGSSDNA